MVRGRFRPDVKRSGVTPGVSSKAGSRFDVAGSSDGQEDRAFLESRKNAFELERRLAEPADVRTDFAATRAQRKFRRRLVKFCVVERRSRAALAPAFEQFTVHVHDAG